MIRTSRQTPTTTAAKRRAIALAGAFLLPVAVWLGCTVTPENYKSLSFWFDGVPDPSAVKGGVNPGEASASSAVVVHPPFAQEKCEACHKTQYRPKRSDPTPCLECHKDLTSKNAWTHGAVAGGACLWCHNPHESARKWLLRGPDRKICTQCHAPAMLASDGVPAHQDAKAGCLECHFGHGGENSLMLRPSVPAAPAAPPDAKPQEPPAAPAGSPPSSPSADK